MCYVLRCYRQRNLSITNCLCSLGNSLVITAVGGGTNVIPFLTGDPLDFWPDNVSEANICLALSC